MPMDALMECVARTEPLMALLWAESEGWVGALRLGDRRLAARWPVGPWLVWGGERQAPHSVVGAQQRVLRSCLAAAGQVPLSVMCRRITGFLQQAWQQHRLRIKPVRHATFHVTCDSRKVPVDAVASGEVSRHDRRPAWRTNATGDGELVELGAL